MTGAEHDFDISIFYSIADVKEIYNENAVKNNKRGKKIQFSDNPPAKGKGVCRTSAHGHAAHEHGQKNKKIYRFGLDFTPKTRYNKKGGEKTHFSHAETRKFYYFMEVF